MSEHKATGWPGIVCPTPLVDQLHITLAHGSGGQLTADLVRKLFLPAFNNEYLAPLGDQAVLPLSGVRVALTTDAFVVTPLFFPGGDIGKLAINGTVNDLAMSGARPLFIAAAFILEEGLAVDELSRIVESMRQAACEAGVQVVTGDTKVVERGKGDKVFITTTGLGVVDKPVVIAADQARPGDKVILSGTIGDHGIAILSQRENLQFEGAITSDTAALYTLVAAMLEASDQIHCLRDPTRGGVATTLNELAVASGVGVEIDEQRIPVKESVKGACEILGLDPLYVANEGKLIALVAADAAEAVVGAMRRHPLGREARIIGEAVAQHPGVVVLRTAVGGKRVLDVLRGEQLPRIC
ncbi:MAG: hydrogenase expression/formation protein HypE [Candidatus Binatia bacterium]|nr:hydrogenase expression/formation protein HypE [Candidatus Binatia bacterium]